MRRLVFGLVILAACGTSAAQQPPPPGLPTPRLQHIFPMGAKAGPAPEISRFGMSFRLDTELNVTGTDLDEPEKLLFSHPGIKAEYIDLGSAPPGPGEKKKGRKQAQAATGSHKFRVTVDASVPPGTYDVRFEGRWGASNPRAFVVGNLKETNEKEPNNDVPEAQRVEIGTTINGVLAAATDVDYSIFAGKKGQRVVLACLTASIDGRASPFVEVFDTDGRKLGQNRGYKDSDAVADVTLPADGDYVVRVSQFAYQGGGPDAFYRLTISTGPWIDAIFPSAVEPGKSTAVTLYGRNLPNGEPANGFVVDGRPLEKLTVTVTPPADAATKLALHGRIEPGSALQDGFEYVFKGPTGVSNPVPIFLARDKLIIKKNAGDSSATAPEAIHAPCEVAGFIARRGDSDWYRFDAKKGDQFLIEVIGERGGTEADFYFSVRDGKDTKKDMSGELDDDNESLHPFGFFTRTADPPAYKFTAPDNGQFLVMVGCRESSVLYGPRTAYRLRVSPAKPDFRAVALPYSRHYQTGSSAWRGGQQAYDVFLHRIDGYTGGVAITAAGLPAGVKAKPLSIGPAARWGILVLEVAPTAAEFTGPITLKATGATGDGKSLVRDVRPASVTWGIDAQQNPSPVIGRLDQSLCLAVRPEKAFFSLTPDLAGAVMKVNNKDEKLAAPLTVKQGEKFSVPVKVNWIAPDKQNVTLTAEPLAQNQQSNPVTVQVPTQPTKDKPAGVVNLDVKSNALPGTYSIVLKGVAQVPFAKESADGKMAKGQNVPETVLSEPILVTVIPSSLAKVSVGNLPNNTLKLGKTGELTIKVDRQYDFTGAFKVTIELPKGVTGVTAADVTIPAGKDEVKLELTADADAKPGAVNNAIITVTAMYDKKHAISHEAKVSFTVAK